MPSQASVVLRGALSVAVSVVGLASASACGGPTPPAASPSTTATVAAPQQISMEPAKEPSLRKFVGEVLPSDVNPASIPGLVPMTSGTVSAPFALVSWPRWDKAPTLSQTLAKAAKDGEHRFMQEHQRSVMAEYNVTWSVTQATDRYAAVNLTTQEFAGASNGTSYQAYIERLADRTMIPAQNLFTADAEKALRARLPELAKKHDIDVFTDGTNDDISLLQAATINRFGDLIVPIAQGTVGPYSSGTLLLTVPKAEVGALLSDEGKAYSAAAMGAPSEQGTQAAGVRPNSADALDPSATAAASASTSSEASADSNSDASAEAFADGPDCRKLKCVALTFDDGPGAETGTVLNTLRDAGVKATFYLVGRSVTADPAIVKRMAAEGHALGNHTWTHPDLKRLGAGEVREQLRRTTEAIKAAAGVGPSSLRPPYGNFGKSTPSEGLPVILWDVDTLDWKTRSTSRTIASAVGSARAGSIVLMHDIHSSTVAAVPEIVRQLKAKGFTLVTIPQLLPRAKGGVVYTSRTETRKP